MRVLDGGENKKKKEQNINYWDSTSIPEYASHVIPPTPTKLSAACGLRHVAVFYVTAA
jgi:hypothetical protein